MPLHGNVNHLTEVIRAEGYIFIRFKLKEQEEVKDTIQSFRSLQIPLLELDSS